MSSSIVASHEYTKYRRFGLKWSISPNETAAGEVKRLFDRTDVTHVRNDIQRIVGSKVRLETNKGRHKSVVSNGIISDAYPSIFTVQLSEGPDKSRKLSFSYTDVLTNTVEITLCDQ